MKAFALFSGGLDSILAVELIRRQKIEVIPICFKTPFFGCENAVSSAKDMNYNLHIFDISEQYMEILLHPKYGYGKNMNPCIDCHGLMFRIACEKMKEYNVDFMISGEVLGERPKSQRKMGLDAVAKLSQCKDLIIRPLSQKLLRDTKPIAEGWINKDRLLDIQGRTRARQIQLAKEWNIKNYPTPAGGCVLTNQVFSQRLRDLIEYNMLSIRNIEYLKMGRQFRLTHNTKLIIGRNEQENAKLLNYINDSAERKSKDEVQQSANYEFLIRAAYLPSPIGVIISKDKDISQDMINLAGGIILAYIRKAQDKDKIMLLEPGQEKIIFDVKRLTLDEVNKFQL